MNDKTLTDPVLVDVQNVSRFYGPNLAVDHISFQVSRGEVLGFLGPNGAGKSTTMQMISGNLAPSSGQILINGIDLLDNPREAKAQLGFLPEQPPLYKDLTVDEYLGYCAQLNRLPGSRIRQAVANAKEKCGLTEVGRRLIGNLSKGYQQRTGIAQAILHAPAIVILDEPTVGLDPIQIREIRSLIRELSSEHSVILSTHILPEVQTVCDRVQIINKGKLVFSDTIANIQHHLSTQAVIAGFASPPPVSELERLAGSGSIRPLTEHKFRIQYQADDFMDLLTSESVTRNWQLRELYPDRLNLEQIFVQLTTGDIGEHSNETIKGPET